MKGLGRIFTIILTLLLVLCVPSACSSKGLKTYELPHYDYSEGDGSEVNNSLFYRNDFQVSLGDPTTLFVEDEEGGAFYTCGTHSGTDWRMWKSRDLTNWEDLGVVMTKTDNFFGVDCWWAPQLFWDAEADWQYYLGEDAGEGKGLYCLFFSARVGADNINHLGQYTCQLAVGFSKSIEGEYKFFNGTNLNGDKLDETTFLFDMEKCKDEDYSEWEKANAAYGPIYKKGRSFIDACPFIDPVSGDKYLYFVCNRYAGDVTNDVWGMKMKDWVTPDYSTVRPLTAQRYTTTAKTEEHDWMDTSDMRIDEGPFMHYQDFTDDGIDNGTYYLTFTLAGGGFKLYSPIQALGKSPLDNFEKVKVADGAFMIIPEMEWDVAASGHHDFFYVGDEIWMSYHTYEIISADEIGSRYWACDKVEFIENEKGQMLMRVNGPSRTIQPLPEKISGYKNVAKSATITASSGDAGLLNDGYLPLYGDGMVNRLADEFVSDKKNTTVKLSWDEYVTARAIMVYNSYDFNSIFESVEKIEFSIRHKIDGKYRYGTAVINDLGYDVEKNRVPLWYFNFTDKEIANGDYDDEFDVIRPCTAATAEFDEIEVNEITITVKRGANKTATGIGEIVVLGRVA